MRFLTICLLFLSTLAHAADGDYLKTTLNGKVYELKGDDLMVGYVAGGTEFEPYPKYVLTAADPFADKRLQLTMYLPVGGTFRPGPFPVPELMESFTAKPPFADLQFLEGTGMSFNAWSLGGPADGEVVITAVQGKVVEGTFRAKLRNTDESVREVANGTFRFTME